MGRTPAHSPIAVVGGSRGTGTLVAALARSQGRETRVVEALGPPHVLRSAFEGARGVIHIPARGVRSLARQVDMVLEAQHGHGPPHPHMVLVTGFSVGHGRAHAMNTREYLEDRRGAEELLRNGGLPYTIVRPTWLTSDPAGRYAVTVTQDPLIDGMIARADLAAACLAACDDPRVRDTTFSLFAQPGLPPDEWGSLFASLVPDHALRR